MSAYTIKDVENLSGIKAHTIRIWEQRYSFLKPQRTETNIRYYTAEELKKLLNVALLNKYGYKISHINKMTPEEMRAKVLSLSNKEAFHERLINEMVHHMIDMDIEKMEAELDNYILTKGIEKAIVNVIFPFLDKIGILWLTNHINPAQEHLVTNIIRQKLIVGIESTVSHLSTNSTVLLFLPEGEHHELGLLYVYYLVRARGAKAIYLGANVPLKDVSYVLNLKKPKYIFTHLTSVSSSFTLEKFIQKLNMHAANPPVIISGLLAQTYTKPVPSNVQLKKSVAEVTEFIAAL